MKTFLAALFASLVFASAANASTEYASGNSWTVYRDVDHCSLLLSFEQNTALYVSYVYATNRSFVAVLDPAFKSVQIDEKYPVEIAFIKSGKVDMGWGTVPTVGINIVGIPGIGTYLTARDLLADIKASNALIISRNNADIIVENFNLKNTALPVEKLEQCSMAVHKTNPADPFAGAQTKPSNSTARDPFERAT